MISKATKQPHVGGLYTILSVVVRSQDGGDASGYFSEPDNDHQKTFVLRYLEELVFQCGQFEDDALKSR